MLRGTLAWAGLGLGISIVACSGSETSGTAASADGACAEFVQVLCAKLEECVPLGIQVSYRDSAQCAERQKDSCLKALSAQGTGATPAWVGGCTEGFRGSSCDAILSGVPLEACKTPAGSLADGTACGDDAQCTGRSCRTTGDNTCGACSTREGAGGSCVTGDDCEEGLACGGGTCVAPATAGASCSANQPCQGRLGCANGTCAEPLGAGVSCEGGGVCDQNQGLFCDPGSKVCKQAKLAGAGESCGLRDGTIVICAGGGNCKDGTCLAAAADGQPCNVETGPNCVEPAECVNGVCTFPDPGTCK